MSFVIYDGDLHASLSDEGVLTIRFNRPKKFNAISGDMYTKFIELLIVANNSSKIRIIVVTGTGSFFTAGNDLNNLMIPM